MKASGGNSWRGVVQIDLGPKDAGYCQDPSQMRAFLRHLLLRHRDEWKAVMGVERSGWPR